MKPSISRSRPAVNRALTFLMVQIETNRGLLDSTRVMASKAGVTQVSMLKAVRVLCREGVLTARRGSGVRVAVNAPISVTNGSRVARAAVAYRSRSQEVAARLAGDISSKHFSVDSTLPMAKQLSVRYGACRATVRHALRTLAARGLLEQNGRSYRIVAGRARTSLASLAFIATMDLREFLDKLGPRSTTLWRSIEEECARNGLSLDIYDYRKSIGTFAWPDGVTKRLTSRIDTSRVLGFMVWPYGMAAQSLAHILDMLSVVDKPVSVLAETWESTTQEYAAVTARGRNTRLFTVALSGQCGTAVGNCLFALGHRKVAVLQPHDDSWGWKVRADAIRGVYESADLYDAVTLHKPEETFSESDQVIARELDAFERASNGLYERYRVPLTESFVANRVGPYLSASRFALAMKPVFERLLDKKEFTAWAGLNDTCARTALHFLRDRDVRVPEDISVTGIDNDSEAFADGLTTYDFNLPAVVHAMFDHILNWKRGPAHVNVAPYTELDGRMIMRRTAGPSRSPTSGR